MKIIKGVTVLRESIDSDREKVILSGLVINKSRVPVLLNFDATKRIGFADGLRFFNNEAVMDFHLMDDVEPKGMFPSVGFRSLKFNDTSDFIRIIRESELICIGLCNSENTDPNIKPIS